MTKKDRKRIEDFRRFLALQELGIDRPAACELERLSRRWRKLATDECSIDSDRQNPFKGADSWYDYQQTKIEKQARELVPEGVELYIQGDCRGLSFYVCGPDVPRPLDSHYDRGVGL